MASRILGMGDVLSLIEKAEEAFRPGTGEETGTQAAQSSSSRWKIFAINCARSRKWDRSRRFSECSRAFNAAAMKNLNVDEKALVRVEAIINSMTQRERNNHSLINGSRRKRIAKGSGTSVEEVNRLLKQFLQAQKMLKQVAGMDPKKMRGRFPFPG